MPTVTDIRQALVEATEKEFAASYLLAQRLLFDWKQYWACVQSFRDDVIQPLSLQLHSRLDSQLDESRMDQISAVVKPVLINYHPKGVTSTSSPFLGSDACDVVLLRLLAALRKSGAVPTSSPSLLDEIQSLREKNASVTGLLTDSLEQVRVLTKQVAYRCIVLLVVATVHQLINAGGFIAQCCI